MFQPPILGAWCPLSHLQSALRDEKPWLLCSCNPLFSTLLMKNFKESLGSIRVHSCFGTTPNFQSCNKMRKSPCEDCCDMIGI